ncbi:MAG TPA: phosphatidylserine decarboxylase, partial [Candidatus Obscuribacterales bacterium]
MPDSTIQLYDRQTRSLTSEQVFEQGQMDFFYGQPLGRWLEQMLLSRRPVSWLYGRLRERRPAAARQIHAFVTTYGIDTAELVKNPDEFQTFQDFFVRELRPGARPLPPDPALLISPADARMLAQPLAGEHLLMVKGRGYTLFELLRNRSLAQQFAGGTALIYRLAPVDYHRFCYIDACRHGPHQRLGKRLHSVNPLALRTGLAVFGENRREYTLLHT